MDQIHLSPLVDQIQLALGHISNIGDNGIGVHQQERMECSAANYRLAMVSVLQQERMECSAANYGLAIVSVGCSLSVSN
jgi:hypothetical protein